MKIVSGLVATVVVGSLVLVGCGSDDEFGPAPDLSAAHERFDRPDGTFNGANAKGVIESGSKGTSGLDFTGRSSDSSGSGTKPKSGGLKLADADSDDSPFQCDALLSGQQTGSCACPSGGSMNYAMSGGQGDSLIRIRLDRCAMDDTVIDGHQYMSMRTNNGAYTMLFVIDATVTSEGRSERVQLQSRFTDGETELAVHVDDGWVVVSIKRDAAGGGVTYSVRDRNGTSTCVFEGGENGRGQCTSSNGETFSW
ncbi:MAG: hypothetical protein KF819_11820 [Labilithrix sp.]|nr:hypothetical protein [Labilithrix sp.]